MIERFLAQLYTDAQLRREFLARPVETAQAAGLDPQTAELLANIDCDGLVLAAASFERKRKAHRR